IMTHPDYRYKRKHREFQKGDLKMGEIKKIQKQMETLQEAARLFPKYLIGLRKRQRYDFADMLRWVRDAFDQYPDLLRRYQEQYLYFLIDEFQDTNGIQLEVLDQLIGFWKNPNVFAVGDDDQSIFEFQGARIKNVKDFYDKFQQHIKVIVLTENYRSVQDILDAAKTLIDHNELRLIRQLGELDLEKTLRAANPGYSTLKVKPQILQFPQRLQEELSIVECIERLRAEGQELHEIAVLFAKHRQSETLIRLLDRKGIPYQTKKRVNILKLPVIRNVITLFQYLDKELQFPYSGEELLFKLLHFPFWEIKAIDLAKLSLWRAKNWRSARAENEYKSPETWRNLIQNQKLLQQEKIISAERLLQASTLLEDLLLNAQSTSVLLLFEQLINQSGMVHYLSQKGHQNEDLQALFSFFRFVEDACVKKPNLRLSELLSTIAKMEANRLDLGMLKVQFSGKEGVQLMTAHASKGLEFDQVFILDAVQKNWEPRKRGNTGNFTFPPTITFSRSEDEMEASRRLFYVAVTRARKGLYISLSESDEDGKGLAPARFVDELLEHNELEIEQHSVAPEKVTEAELMLLRERSVRMEDPMLSTEAIDLLLEDFSMSPTGLCNYLACPIRFYFEQVLRVPSSSSEAAAYGTAVHYALKRFFEKAKALPENNFPTAEVLVADFVHEMERQKLFFETSKYEHWRDFGAKELPDYLNGRLQRWEKEKNSLLEIPIRDVEMRGVPLTGHVDKLVLHSSNSAGIIDYKTSKFRKGDFSPPSDKDPIGGDYWRQLVFYKILLDGYPHIRQRIDSAAIDYLNRDTDDSFPIQAVNLDQQAVETVKTQISDTYRRIRNHEFQEGCGDDNCKWCQFVKARNQEASMRNERTERLDDN
ncbi:MAG: ATP-dependent DNA helicase, partial [Bacteroidota bacterium]